MGTRFLCISIVSRFMGTRFLCIIIVSRFMGTRFLCIPIVSRFMGTRFLCIIIVSRFMGTRFLCIPIVSRFMGTRFLCIPIVSMFMRTRFLCIPIVSIFMELVFYAYTLFLGLWGLVNNAGIMPNYCPAELTSLRDYKRVCDVNLFGSICMTNTFLPLIRKAEGRIVNMCSVVANVGLTATASYSISKSGLRMFSTCLR